MCMNIRTITTFILFTSSRRRDTEKELNKAISHVTSFLLVNMVNVVNCPGFHRLALTKWDYAVGELGECVAIVESTAKTRVWGLNPAQLTG